MINIKIAFISAFFVIFLLGYLFNKFIFIEIIKDLRWLRLTHYILMLILGVIVARPDTINNLLIVNGLLVVLSMLFASLYCIVTNNIIDRDIDRVSNQSRPLITGSIPFNVYLAIGIIAAFLALGCAMVISWYSLVIIATIMITYSLYSLPPLRLKRIPVFSKMVISINSLAVIYLGYLLALDNVKQFPIILLPIFLIGFTLSINFIDLKDVDGDTAGNIKTIPVLLGSKNAALIIGSAFFLTYLSFYFLVKNKLILPFLFLGGLLQFICVNKKNYSERLVFLIYLASMISLIFWLRIFS